jgi:hypothetical protein
MQPGTMVRMTMLLILALIVSAYAYMPMVPRGIALQLHKVRNIPISQLPNAQCKFERNLLGHAATASSDVIALPQPPLSFRSRLIGVNRLVYRSSWVAWWIQIVLSVISCVILTFANAVRPMGVKGNYLWISGFAFSSIGVLVGLMNAFWTWNVTRLCRRIVTKNIEDSKAVSLHRKYAKTSVLISLVGMLFALLGAEQIVGTLASKILSAGSFGYAAPAGVTLNGALAVTPIQAVDIFLVQANTNSLLSHFASLVCYLFLQTRLPRSLIVSSSSSYESSGSAAAPATISASGNNSSNKGDGVSSNHGK